MYPFPCWSDVYQNLNSFLMKDSACKYIWNEVSKLNAVLDEACDVCLLVVVVWDYLHLVDKVRTRDIKGAYRRTSSQSLLTLALLIEGQILTSLQIIKLSGRSVAPLRQRGSSCPRVWRILCSRTCKTALVIIMAGLLQIMFQKGIVQSLISYQSLFAYANDPAYPCTPSLASNLMSTRIWIPLNLLWFPGPLYENLSEHVSKEKCCMQIYLKWNMQVKSCFGSCMWHVRLLVVVWDYLHIHLVDKVRTRDVEGI